ncbi:Beta-hydroxyacyl-(acyl-carrier-protein) dehydratase FabA/FabZ [Pirellula staleyi DSM 6068]|uniref:Beta-hydroxyacyl-(Acyl-carrier-protein) dehydratase FabA/FabZ n=1 Tax=Pirellula staleyi (strain ATCC 27377 / DSM 6068 / ICPB 4128) TaxID=530564 RepID=D2R446_PIRSD|nr:3-hydroxyacyl-ACP dehydratase FabZ family protein [Pirellula staleyi]ADB18895.1 Beta-hydroxyacyl-(acyl-carrier-protein) dehydratase FabA/FabZ [Pirellula staleyi DSM 6068]
MTLAQIHAAIPHRPPMLLVDEVVLWEPERIVCKKTLSGEEFFFQGHYPGFPLMPGVMMCEASLQTGAVLMSKIHPDDGSGGVPVATRLNDVKFKRMVRPGDTIEIDVKLDERLGDAYFLSSKVTCGGKVTATLSFAVTITKVA